MHGGAVNGGAADSFSIHEPPVRGVDMTAVDAEVAKVAKLMRDGRQAS